MKYSHNAISEYLSGSIGKEVLIEYLDLLGLNPLVISSDEKDIIFELETPANRGYLLSLLGVAREVLPFTSCDLKLPDDGFEEDFSSDISLKIESENDCPYYSCRVMNGVKNVNSPEHIREVLNKMGYRSSFSTVDISNFVMAEIGQPLHIFDLDTIEGYVEIRRGRKGEVSELIDGKKIEINEDILVIADAVKVIAVAGIMGCSVSEVKESTKNILIESAIFNPSVVRKGSKKLGLATDASLRFERGMDKTTALKGMLRATHLIHKIGGGKIGNLNEAGSIEEKSKEVVLDKRRIEKLLGIDVEEDFIVKTLEKLGFSIRKNQNTSYIIKAPVYRNDIKEDVDVIEEIARYGKYSEIPSEMPLAVIEPTPSANQVEEIEKIKDISVKLGFSEFINMGLTDKRSVEFNKDSLYIPVENPLSANLGYLRTSLIPEILESIKFNVYHGFNRINIFEVGKVYLSKDNDFREELKILFVSVNSGDFFVLKGKVEKFLEECGIEKISFLNKPNPFSREGCSTSIFAYNRPDTELGKLFIPSDDIKSIYDIKEEEIYICEMYLEPLSTLLNFERSFKSLPKFPYSSRDFSFILNKNISWEDIEKTVRALDMPVEKINFFDAYEGKNIESGKISISFSVFFRYPDKTLESVEIKKFSDIIIETINTKFKGILRGEDRKC
ncbi:phenylalanine--tRNA ligase subunit beta [bacterium]|nr:phenylalanine--tRNA ligase subunit beta [bacterium]